jgi:hypothetical protein
VLLAFTTTEKVNIALAIASAGVAFATGYLAWKTRGMARETQRMAAATETEAQKVADQARATERQARISAAALSASIRPWLTMGTINVPVTVDVDSEQSLRVLIRVRNVGPGLAMILPDGCTIRGGGREPGTTLTRPGYTDSPVLPPMHEAWVEFNVEGSDVEKDHFLGKTESFGQVTVSILYFDADIKGGRRADFRIAATDAMARQWIFNEVDYVQPLAEDEHGEIIDWEVIATVKFRPDA